MIHDRVCLWVLVLRWSVCECVYSCWILSTIREHEDDGFSATLKSLPATKHFWIENITNFGQMNWSFIHFMSVNIYTRYSFQLINQHFFKKKKKTTILAKTTLKSFILLLFRLVNQPKYTVENFTSLFCLDMMWSLLNPKSVHCSQQLTE